MSHDRRITPRLGSDAGALIAAFDAQREALGAAPVREAARGFLAEHGIPTRRSEAFRYTDLAALARFTAPGAQGAQAEARAGAILHPFLAAQGLADVARVVVVDGLVSAGLSVPSAEVATTLVEDADEPGEGALLALNAMLTRGGVSLSVEAGVAAGRMLLVHVALGGAAAAHPRHSLSLAEGASLELLEIDLGEDAYLHNSVFDITLAEDSALTHVRIQNAADEALSFATVRPVLQARARYEGFCLALGGTTARHEVRARLEGEAAIAHVNAAQLGRRDGQVLDLTSEIAHLAFDTRSLQTVKTVLDGRARGVFSGRIHVAREAQKTDGYQLNQALLLSDSAEMDARPELEIYADDVKCSHGVTIGALDEEQLFYMRSRGVPAAEAEALLVRAFLADVLSLVEAEASRGVLERVVDAWWAQA